MYMNNSGMIDQSTDFPRGTGCPMGGIKLKARVWPGSGKRYGRISSVVCTGVRTSALATNVRKRPVMQALHLQHSAAHRNTKARQLPADSTALRCISRSCTFSLSVDLALIVIAGLQLFRCTSNITCVQVRLCVNLCKRFFCMLRLCNKHVQYVLQICSTSQFPSKNPATSARCDVQ